MKGQTVGIIVVLFANAGCERGARVATLQLAVDSLRAAIDSADTRISSIELDQILAKIEGVALLKPSDAGYDIMKTDLGVITVSLENVEPYANGSRVTLQFGNATAADLSDPHAKVQWGSVDDKGTPNYSTARSRDVAFDKSLRGGSWTKLSVVLDGVPPAELGFVRLSEFGNRGISLRR